jgi:low affinity Fe/Cu permease
LKLHKTRDGGLTSQQRESIFDRTADYVSAAMGRPANIIVWFVLVAAWTALGPYLAHHPFLPAWSVSTGWNFPLNLVTTVAELFIGFLVAAASNRAERNLEATLAANAATEQRISDMNEKIADLLDCRTEGGLSDVLTAIRALSITKEGSP